MGERQSTIKDSNANVINEIVVTEVDGITEIKYMLLIISILISLQFFVQVYQMHNRTIKKKYLARSASTDKI